MSESTIPSAVAVKEDYITDATVMGKHCKENPVMLEAVGSLKSSEINASPKRYEEVSQQKSVCPPTIIITDYDAEMEWNAKNCDDVVKETVQQEIDDVVKETVKQEIEGSGSEDVLDLPALERSNMSKEVEGHLPKKQNDNVIDFGLREIKKEIIPAISYGLEECITSYRGDPMQSPNDDKANKRKRGRPKKFIASDDEKSAEFGIMEDTASNEDENPDRETKRKCGRPPKPCVGPVDYAQDEVHDDKNSFPNSNEVARPRGRPRKLVEPNFGEYEEAVSENEWNVIEPVSDVSKGALGRRRGQPRKSVKPTESFYPEVETDDLMDDFALNTDSVYCDNKDKAKSRKRGRPRKNVRDDEMSSQSENAAETSCNEDEIVQEIKRKRGRPPKKSITPEKSELFGSEKRRGRGRPRKSVQSDKDILVVSEMEGNLQSSVSSFGDSVLQKRPRGRPRKSFQPENEDNNDQLMASADIEGKQVATPQKLVQSKIQSIDDLPNMIVNKMCDKEQLVGHRSTDKHMEAFHSDIECDYLEDLTLHTYGTYDKPSQRRGRSKKSESATGSSRKESDTAAERGFPRSPECTRINRRKSVPCKRKAREVDTEDEEIHEGLTVTPPSKQTEKEMSRKTRRVGRSRKIVVNDRSSPEDPHFDEIVMEVSRKADEKTNSPRIRRKSRKLLESEFDYADSVRSDKEKKHKNINNNVKSTPNTPNNAQTITPKQRGLRRPRKSLETETSKGIWTMEESHEKTIVKPSSVKKRGKPRKELQKQTDPVEMIKQEEAEDFTGKQRRRSKASRRTSHVNRSTSHVQGDGTPSRDRDSTKTKSKSGTQSATKQTYSCVHCSLEGSRDIMHHHMLKEHIRDWTPENPEGIFNPSKAIRLLGKIQCSGCKRDFRFSSYYQHHVEWCGREDETTVCEECQRPVKSMWLKVHLRNHAKQREKEAAKLSCDGKEEEEEERTSGRSSRRKAAAIAMKNFSDLSAKHDSEESSDDSVDEYQAKDSKSSSEDDDDDDDGTDLELAELEPEPKRNQKAISNKPSRTAAAFIPWTTGIPETRKRHCSLDSLDVLSSWTSDISDWHLLPSSEVDDYLPQSKVSVPFFVQNPTDHKSTEASKSSVKRDELENLMLYQVRQVKDGCMVFTGGPIWALDWCSTPLGTETDQYMALYCHRNPRLLTPLDCTTSGQALIQLWNCGRLTIHSKIKSDPKLEFALAMDYGSVFELKWCPHGGWNKALNRLGILAAATSSGRVVIYSIPFIDGIANRNGDEVSVFQVTPAKILVQQREPDAPCMCLGWHVSDKQTQIAAGFADGTASVWSLSTVSPLTKLDDGDAILVPSQTFLCHHGPVTGLTFCPLSGTHMSTVSHDRYMKVWDLREPDSPVYSLTRSKLETVAMMTYWPIVVTGGDDCFSLGANATHFCDVRPGEHNSKPVTSHASTIWSLSYNQWMHSILSCDNTGTVVTAILHMLDPRNFQRNMEMSKLRVPLMITRQYTIPSEEDDQTTEGDSASEHDVPSDTTMTSDVTSDLTAMAMGLSQPEDSRTCMEYILYKNTDSCTLQQSMVPSIQRDDISNGSVIRAMHRVMFNPNETSFLWYATGGKAGVLFIRKLHYPKGCLPNKE